MSICPEAPWESYSYQTDEGPVIVGFYTEAARLDRTAHPFCARVLIPIQAPTPQGGPTGDEVQALWAMEDALVAALDAARVPCIMIGRLTHGGTRELIFQVADYAPFRPPVGRWMQTQPGYEIDVSEHDGWDFFFESVWPSENSWLLIMDRRVVDELVASGSDPAKEHSLEFVFCGAPAALASLQPRLESRGYRLHEFSPDQSRLVMAKSLPLDVSAIFGESLAHKDECAQLGLEYNGWGATVVS